MRLSSIFAIAGTFFAAAILSWIAAGFAVTVIEDSSRNSVRRSLDLAGLSWAEVDADGLKVFMAGIAPTEARRFKALSVAGSVVDAARVIDQIQVEDAAEIAPPRFSVEILRNDSGISLIGLIPAATDYDAFLKNVRDTDEAADVADLLNRADYPVPEGWEDALRFASRALKFLPHSKISVDAERVAVIAMTDTREEKFELEQELTRLAPDSVALSLDISAPRPVITPFTLRFLIEGESVRFDACSADTEDARARILAAAERAGLAPGSECTIGLGVPTPQWGVAAELAIDTVAALGGGSVTFKDADISLIALQGTPEDQFDDVVGELENALPDVFALHAVLPAPAGEAGAAIPEFVATLSPEGLVQLRGRLGSERLRDTVDSFARARFSSGDVYTKARVVDGLPSDWPVRVLAGLEALSYLSNGAVTVMPDTLSITGNTGRKEASAQIAGFLAQNLGEAAHYDINVTYKEQLDPIASIPTADECIAIINSILSARKITFEPGSANIDASGGDIMDDIAEVLRGCGEIRIEIGGHTDSQGRETMNQQLSQNRALAVLDALRARRVVTSTFVAQGYGESAPIADNETEEGRENNRRIEFTLIKAEPTAEEQTGLESLEKESEEETSNATTDQEEAPHEQD